MKTRTLLILGAVVVALGAWILLFERHQPTGDEARERADKVFPNLERDDITAIEIRNSHGTFRLQQSGTDWRITEPIDAAADSGTVSSLLGSMVNLSRERTLEPGEVDPTAYGLDAPAMSVALHTADGARHELLVGEEAALGSNRAVSRGGGEVIMCAAWFAADLDKELYDWRSKDVVDVYADQVASFELVAGDDRITAVRDGETWTLLEPLNDLADREYLRTVISDLNGLTVEEFLDQGSDTAELGLEPPAQRVTLVRTEGSEPVVLELGATREVDGATHVACRRGDGALFWVDNGAQVALGKAPVRWRSPTVFPFDTWTADGVTFAADDTAVAVVKDQGLWQLSDGGEVDTGEVIERLTKLAQLEAIDFDLVLAGTAELGRVELRLPADDGEEVGETITYSFFAPLTEGGNALVAVSARDTVMSVALFDAERIVGRLEALTEIESFTVPD